MNKLENFNMSFVNTTLEDWRSSADKYRSESANLYKKLRSYLTFYQFCLSDDQKCEISEKVSQTLDEIENNLDVIEEMDSYMNGFRFRLDKSILPIKKDLKNSVRIDQEKGTNLPTDQTTAYDKIQGEAGLANNSIMPNEAFESVQPLPVSETIGNEFVNCASTLDTTDLDYYTLQFFQ